MNEIENKVLLVGNKFMPEMHLRQLGFTYSACVPFRRKNAKIKKTLKIHHIFTKTNQIKLVFNVTWLMEVLKI